MKNRTSVIQKLFLSAALSFAPACHQSSPATSGSGGLSPGPSASEISPLAAGWSIRLAGACADHDRDNCMGANGFTLGDDGVFRIGPAELGFDGQVTPEELGEVVAELGSVAAEPGLGSTLCLPETVPVETFAAVQLGHRETLLDAPRTACARLPHAEHGERLHQRLAALLEKYYPMPFPSKCLAASSTLNGYYAKFQHCQEDRDCTYVNPEVLPVGPGTSSLGQDDCSYVRPFVVGNGFEVVANQLSILSARDAAQRECGAAVRPGCAVPRELELHDLQAPYCRAGVCAPGFRL